MGIFTAAVIYDLWGGVLSRRILPVMLGVGSGFFGITLLWPHSFLVFIIYESLIMFFALTGYVWLAWRGNLEGAWLMVFGVLVTIVAGIIQANNDFSFTFIWSFDHNGIYHLVQMAGILLLVSGLRRRFISHDASFYE